VVLEQRKIPTEVQRMKTYMVQNTVTALVRKSKRFALPAKVADMPERDSEGGNTEGKTKNCAGAWPFNASRGIRRIQILMGWTLEGSGLY
jgi:hypothetical protein